MEIPVRFQNPSFESVYAWENLCLAWTKVYRGKLAKPSILHFYRALEHNLASIADDLKNATYTPSPHTHFIIKDPKERVISASSVRDRVVQHALLNRYDPVFERQQIFDSYACRVGKGTHKAVLRAFHCAKGASPLYFLKMDVRKYFDSIDHGILKHLLTKIIKDDAALRLFYTIIDSTAGNGIPIGNLTSQYFANQYLSGFDHYLKEQCRVKKYLRYMDDMLLFSPDKRELADLYTRSVSYCAEHLRLALKPPTIGPVTSGAPFLGFLLKPRGIYLQQKAKKRYKARMREIEHKLRRGVLSEREAGVRAESVTAHLLLARSRNFRNTVIHAH